MSASSSPAASPPPATPEPRARGGRLWIVIFFCLMGADLFLRQIWDRLDAGPWLKAPWVPFGIAVGAALAMTARTWIARAMPRLDDAATGERDLPRVRAEAIILTGVMIALFGAILWGMGLLDWYALQRQDLLQEVPARPAPDASQETQWAWMAAMSRVEPLILTRLLGHLASAVVSTLVALGVFGWCRRQGWLPQLDVS